MGEGGESPVEPGDEGSPPPERRPVPLPLLLVGVAALYLAVALPLFIAAPHTGGDNAGYLSLAVSIVERGAYLELWDPAEPLHTKYPPGFPLLLAAALYLGAVGWTTFKALSVAAVGGTILLSFLLARRRVGTRGALAVALLLTLSDAFLWASTWILSEPFFMVLTMGALVLLQGRGGEVGEVGSSGPPPRGIFHRRAELPGGVALAAGCLLALLAYLTRSAGIPLLAAVVGWLVLSRAWKPALFSALAFTAVALPWVLRGRTSRDEGYLSEFWMLDPYRPELGEVGFPGLLVRAVDNGILYATEYIPRGLVALEGGWVALVGVGLLGLAAAGWLRSCRRGPGVAELFLPLYGVLILLWPQVWSGDRFALPLYPLLLVYAVEGVRWGTSRVGGRVAALVGTGAVLVVALPAAAGWWQAIPGASACRALVAREGPFACYDLPVREWGESARWSASALPPDAVVFSRKPRLFYVLSGGIRSLTYPFSDDPDAFFREAEAAGIRYLLVDRLDAMSPLYVVPLVVGHPERFCAVAGWGDPESVRTELLGILPEADAADGVEQPEGEDGAVMIRRCPPEYVVAALRPEIPYGSMEVPLLRRLRDGG